MVGHRGGDADVANWRNLHKEPAVLDQDMIIEAIKKAIPKGNEAKYAKESGIDPKKADVLAIEFQSISQIANISHMVLLKKLTLSNNVINRIEGLDTLENLEELDLSFNSIKKLEGLDHLPKLKILNIHRNLISVIENLDEALRLETIVISTNGIKTFEDIRQLRRLVRLRALVLEGNPICDEADFRNFIIALLPDLLILDYIRVKPSERSSPGVMQFQKKVTAIAEVEDGSRRRASVVEADQELQKVYRDAFADGLDSDDFWKALTENDTEMETIMTIPGANDIQQPLQDLMSRTCHELFVKAMRAYTMRQNEYNAFTTAVKEVKDEIITHGRELTEEFLQFSENAMEKLRPLMAQLELRDRMNGGTEFKDGKVPPDYLQLQEELTTNVLAYVKKLHKLWYCLITAEVELNEQIMEVGHELERSLRELMIDWMEELREYFAKIRDIQLQLHEQLNESLVTNDEDRTSDPSIPENLKALLVNKQALGGLLQASHDHHNAVIGTKEESLILNLKNWTEASMAGIRTDEVDRSRRRISEISHFADYHYGNLKEAKMISHCLGVIPPVRDDQNYIPTRKELKQRRRARRQERENQKNKGI